MRRGRGQRHATASAPRRPAATGTERRTRDRSTLEAPPNGFRLKVFDQRPPTRPKAGANGRNRTDDLLITSELLYRLSYVGPKMRHTLYRAPGESRQHLDQHRLQHYGF